MKMVSRKELKLAYVLAIVLFVVGLIGYAVSAEEPEQPLRIMFKSLAGKVFFDHQTHLDESGYGISCKDCHHHPQEDEVDLRACGDCHQEVAEGEIAPAACFDCHEEDELEDSETTGRADAFHTQCIECHVEYEAGPQDGSDDCTACHIL